jgi:hypothetical protein
MINESRYQAAQAVSDVIENHFIEQIEFAHQKGEKGLASAPKADFIEAMIDACFWASLRREEGNSPKISLAFLPAEQAGHPLIFDKKIPLTPAILTKLSPGVERPGIHLGVWHENNQLYIWGTTLKIPNYCFVLDVSEPGLLVIKHRRMHGFGKFANVAVLNGDQIKIVDDKNAFVKDYPDLLKSLLGINSNSAINDSMSVLIQLLVSMRAHKHGGTLLVVPEDTESWRESIIHPIKYSLSPPYHGITNLIRTDEKERSQSNWHTALRTETDSIAGLTAVDGATLITNQYQVHAFGVKIGRAEGRSRVEKVFFQEPIVGGESVILNPAQSGGTRHLSAAQFVYDQRDTMALVASQDGHCTIFTWAPHLDMVQAHKIDILLL